MFGRVYFKRESKYIKELIAVKSISIFSAIPATLKLWRENSCERNFKGSG